jgi:hypothetical protein
MLKRLNGSIWGLLALVVIFSGVTLSAQTAAPAPKKASAAGTAKKASAGAEKTATGTITSIDATKVVVNHMVKGKSEQTTLVLTPETKREGVLAAGGKVSAKYRTENNEQVATLVRSMPTTAAKAKTGKGSAAKKAS